MVRIERERQRDVRRIEKDMADNADGSSKTSETESSASGEITRTKYGCIFKDADGKNMEIRDVWAENLEKEMAIVRECVEKNPYVAMDTEFPGVVAKPVESFNSQSVDFHYQTLRVNCDMLKVIQVGLAFFDKDGKRAEGYPVWQFNFRFDLNADMYAVDSVELLKRSGIDFKKHQEKGIDIFKFGELLIPSGLVLTDDVRWISFHSGYDFGYLLRLATCLPLPTNENSFFELMKVYFPNVYDIKHLVRDIDSLWGGLAAIAKALDVPRVGPAHQAGSDALVTAETFFALKKKHFDGNDIALKYSGVIYGLRSSHIVYGSTKSG